MSAAPVLTARPGDPQAAKAAIAAAAAALPLNFVAAAPGKTFGPFGGLLELSLPSGSAICEANAAARAACAGQLVRSETWLDWEERVLRAAVYSGCQRGPRAPPPPPHPLPPSSPVLASPFLSLLAPQHQPVRLPLPHGVVFEDSAWAPTSTRPNRRAVFDSPP